MRCRRVRKRLLGDRTRDKHIGRPPLRRAVSAAAFPTDDLPVRFRDVEGALERIRPHVHRTPVLTSATLDAKSGAQVFLKCENHQKTGSFKARGATNAVAQLTVEERERGVVTHSSGNHAQALAYACGLFGVPCTVIMPMSANPLKREATEGYGARVVPCKDSLAARMEETQKVIDETGAVLVHPYDNERIIAGAGTAALELMAEVPDLDLVIAPVGGGGLAAGTTVVAKHQDVDVLLGEPYGADDAFRSLDSGERVVEHAPHTIADGLLTTLGARNFQILHHHKVPVQRVKEEEIIFAMQYTWERTKLLIEPSSAVAVAALLHDGLDVAGKRVGVILSGGNVDVRGYFVALEGQAAGMKRS